MKRSKFLQLAVAVSASVVTFSAVAQTSNWPQSPIKIIVPFGAGSGADQVARLIGQELSTSLGQPVIIDNKAGAGGNIGAQAAARAPADGYTLFVTTNTTHLNP